MKSINKNIIVGLIGIMLLVSLVSAFGVVTYNDPIKVKPGESIDLTFGLQNMAGDQDYIVESAIGADEGITVKLLDSNKSYNVPLGTQVPVNFRVTVPENAKIGDKFTVGATFTAIPAESKGTLSLQTAIGTKVIIEVAPISDDTNKITPVIKPIETPQKTNTKMMIIILLVIVIIVAVYLIVSKKKK